KDVRPAFRAAANMSRAERGNRMRHGNGKAMRFMARAPWMGRLALVVLVAGFPPLPAPSAAGARQAPRGASHPAARHRSPRRHEHLRARRRSAARVPQRPCDVYAKAGTPCAAAFSSTRALFAQYTGPLYEVTRASDGA